ncbi:MAG: Fe-S cluster assembly protein HesB [Actinomycetota bacterium]|nr:Fe-S cluster assembly protein HesB [Actinomycetota bacterium]
MSESATFFITGQEQADRLLATNPLALLIGMLLDQQVPMEWAFQGPARLAERLGGELDVAVIASLEPVELDRIFRERPAIHRFPSAMSKRVRALCRHLEDRYDGRSERVWNEATSGHELLERVRALPGFGDEKARIFVALLGKRLGVKPPGWEEASAPFSDDVPRSVADIDSPETLAQVRDWKRTQKARGKGKAD